jgi:hypothetical protein
MQGLQRRKSFAIQTELKKDKRSRHRDCIIKKREE